MPATDGDKILAAARIGAARDKSYWCRAWRSTTQSVGATTEAAISFDYSDQSQGGGVYDPQGMHDHIGDPTKLFARVRGMYGIRAAFVGTGGSLSSTTLRLDLVTATGTYAIAQVVPVIDVVSLLDAECFMNDGEAIRLVFNNASGGGRDVVSTARYVPVLQLRLLESSNG